MQNNANNLTNILFDTSFRLTLYVLESWNVQNLCEFDEEENNLTTGSRQAIPWEINNSVYPKTIQT